MKKRISLLLICLTAFFCFFSCSKQESNHVPSDVPSDHCGKDVKWRFDEETGTLFIEGKGKMWDFVSVDENGERVVEDNKIPWHEINNEEKIKRIEIGEGVTYIGDSAFYTCTEVESVKLPSTLEEIGPMAFCLCYSLKEIEIPDNVKIIRGAAFAASGLTTVTIPDSVTVFEHNVFLRCGFLESVKLPKNITTIPDESFSDCSSLKEVTIPDSVTSIGKNAFSGCDLLEEVTIPESVTSIGETAFQDCKKLKKIYFGGTRRQWYELEIRNASINFASVECAK